MKLVRPKILALVAVIAVLGGLPAYAQDRFRDINANVPAANVRTVVVDANVGTVRLSGTSGDSVRIDLRLEAKRNYSLFSFFGGRRRGDVNGVDLRTDVRGTELRITLRGDRDDLEEDWMITVPVQVEAKVTVNVGDIDLNGVTGGCEAVMNVGKVRIDVPEGHIRAVTNVGDLVVRTSTRSYGDVRVSANVGDTRLVVDGHRVPNAKRNYGPGGRVTFNGPGRDRIDVRASVGDAEVTIR